MEVRRKRDKERKRERKNGEDSVKKGQQ